MKLRLLVIHCTATPYGMLVTPADIRRWHTSPVSEGGRGWKQVGYSDMIMQDGMVVNLVPYDEDDQVEPWEITNGAVGVNSYSRHVVYVGGMSKNNKKPMDTRTPAQLASMESYIHTLISLHENIKIAGHNQFAKKACPSFNVPAWLRSIRIKEQNIYENIANA